MAINEITNPTLAPSQILGAIHAPGQVYVINQNGIIFGGSSQVNVGGLTASALALNPDYINNGLLNDATNNYEFQFSSLFTTTSQFVQEGRNQVLVTTVAPLWTATPATPAGGSVTISSVPTGDVTVQAGAQLSSPTNAENQGGRIALIGPNVTNHGTISTPDGQTILAAGLQVGLSAHNADDASLRGLDVFVGQVSAGASTLPTGTFTFDGLPNNGPVTFSGTGQVGSYLAPGSTTPTPILANMPAIIPTGSVVTNTGGTATYGAFAGGKATNAASVIDGQGNIVTPGGRHRGAAGRCDHDRPDGRPIWFHQQLDVRDPEWTRRSAGRLQFCRIGIRQCVGFLSFGIRNGDHGSQQRDADSS